MSDQLYARAQAIAHEVLEQPANERDSFLDAKCGTTGDLRREVDWLIRAARDTSLDEVPACVTEVAADYLSELQVSPTATGSYHLIRRLGEGGMGVVWLAERRVGDAVQRVALKRVRGTVQASRFGAEQRILATLSHPNIARLVDAGIDRDGASYLAMDYVEGMPIDRYCETRYLDLRALIRLFVKVCAAVTYAHERLIIHRDLKPSNILVEHTGEPKLLDFGIARFVDATATASESTWFMTPAYASPEQIEGAPLGTATDIWSLGIVLYELLTGVHPFKHLKTEQARTRAVLVEDVARPSRLLEDRVTRSATAPFVARARRIPTDIDAIVLKALRVSPEQRYASVRDLSADLERFLHARPVLARRGRWLYTTQRFVQRNRWPIGAGFILVAMACGFTWRTVQAEREALAQARTAERTADFLVSAFALSDPSQAERNDFSARDVLDRGRDRIDEELADEPRIRARLLEAVGNAYRGINEGNAGAPLFEEAARLNLEPNVNDPVAAARSLVSKAGSILDTFGSTAEAELSARRALELVRRHAPNDGVMLATTYATLARALDASGHEEEAVALARQALALREAAGAPPLEIAHSLVGLCSVVSATGAFSEALAYCERALELYSQADARRSNDYRVALRRFSNALLYSGDRTRAHAMIRERLELTRELFGDDSAVLALDRVYYSEVLGEAGAFVEAEALLEASVPVILRHNGPTSTQYALAVFHKGWLKFLQGKFESAATLLRDALAIHTANVGARDNDRLQVLRTTLAQALIESGHADSEARSLLDAVLAARGPNASGSVLAYARLPLAKWFVLNGDYDAAERLLDQVEAVGTQVESELHARARSTRAAILLARGDIRASLDERKAAFDITLADHGPDNPRTARYALDYAGALQAVGEEREAAVLVSRYGRVLERGYPPTSAFRRPSTKA